MVRFDNYDFVKIKVQVLGPIYTNLGFVLPTFEINRNEFTLLRYQIKITFYFGAVTVYCK